MIYVVGCNHEIQHRDDSASVDPLRMDQRSHFAELLERIMNGDCIQFVGEEWGRPYATIARDLAESYRVPWVNINTSVEDRRRMGIPAGDYALEPYTKQQKELWDREREKFMVHQIARNRGAAQNLLVVCGLTHLKWLSDLLGQDGNQVNVVDYRKLPWHRDVFLDERQLDSLIKDLSSRS